MNYEKLYSTYLKSTGVSTDTRAIGSGNIFFALKGPSFNGNTFAEQALKEGAMAVVIDEPVMTASPEVFLVENVLESLQELARIHRSNIDAKVIGLTGSNGKTTAKELFRSVLATSYRVHATPGNLNNHIGMPITILNTPKETEILIVEMGANHQGEIRMLSAISNPDIGYITNFGKAHLEGFGGVEGVIKGKSELYENVAMNEAMALVNGFDPIQLEKTSNINRTVFGPSDSDFPMTFSTQNYPASVRVDDIEIDSNLTGAFHTANIGAAIALGHLFKISLEDIKAGVAAYKPSNNRSEWRKTENNRVMLDAYNANPSSMAASIQSFIQEVDGGATLILGDMFELGESSAEEHQSIVDICETLDCQVILVGEHFYSTTSLREMKRFKKTDDALEYIESHPIMDGSVLLKGSRGMKLETLLPSL